MQMFSNSFFIMNVWHEFLSDRRNNYSVKHFCKISVFINVNARLLPNNLCFWYMNIVFYCVVLDESTYEFNGYYATKEWYPKNRKKYSNHNIFFKFLGCYRLPVQVLEYFFFE